MIQVWATNKNGDGMVQSIGQYDEIEEITIRIGHFDKDVVITFEQVNEKE